MSWMGCVWLSWEGMGWLGWVGLSWNGMGRDWRVSFGRDGLVWAG